ncbi:hypothetical protein BC826DRAFT_1189613 [Russula brevipes]|nr:hypothetical protein BC826DRAFT_1189613 [Russula brevipes]
MGNCCSGSAATPLSPLSAPTPWGGGASHSETVQNQNGSQVAPSKPSPPDPGPRSHRQPNAGNGSFHNTASPSSSSLVPDEHPSLPPQRVVAPPTNSSLLTPPGTEAALTSRTPGTNIPGRLPSFRAASTSIRRTTSELPPQLQVPVLPPSAVPLSRAKSGTGYLGSANPKGGQKRYDPDAVPCTISVTIDYRFRMLIVGKKGSGKSSLIETVFKVDMPRTKAGKASGEPDINLGFRPKDNDYLVVHEYSGFEPGDTQSLQNIRDFISYRTNSNRSALERLHAVWICIPTSDLISRNVGEGIKDILGMEGVPVIVAFTKFDLLVSQLLIDSGSGNTPHRERARNNAYTQCEQSCRSLFGKKPRDVPAEIISRKFGDLVDKLVVTTDKFIMNSRATYPPARSREPGTKSRISPIPLAWSAALRQCRDIIIQTSIEVGRYRYWRSLWSSTDFQNRSLKDCVNDIHIDIAKVWNMNDKAKYLSSTDFMEQMSHIVQDLTDVDGREPMSSGSSGSGDKFAKWVNGTYNDSQENVQCVMGYIVDLTVILDDIFRTAEGNVSLNHVRSAVDRHVRSGRRDRIHQDIRSFVTETYSIRFKDLQRDLALEKIIDLIRQYCAPPSARGSGND